MLLAYATSKGEDYEFHGEPFDGRCRLFMQPASGRPIMLLGVFDRATIKRTIRDKGREHLVEPIFGFPWPGDDPWPLHTQAGRPGQVDPPAPQGSYGEYGPLRLEELDAVMTRVLWDRQQRPARHPAADLLGEGEEES